MFGLSCCTEIAIYWITKPYNYMNVGRTREEVTVVKHEPIDLQGFLISFQHSRWFMELINGTEVIYDIVFLSF